jgi:4-hydroxy-3-methylbut-2-enyl diphosphate reductase
MRKFDIPAYYRSPIISKVKAKRKAEDPRKRDFSPTRIDLGNVTFIIPRHFGFCFGVENAIEISYKALKDHPDKRIYLLSQMIHNPVVNKDLQEHGISFIQDTEGNQLIPWDQINQEDVVIVPAFGTTLETEEILKQKGVDIASYNTTCPFVEKVWKRSEKLGKDDHTIIIHGKAKHEETKATFSHSKENAPSLIILNMKEAQFVGDYILGQYTSDELLSKFEGKYSEGFDPEIHLNKFGVVNQTTMLATETQEIADYLKSVIIEKYGENNYKDHFADTRDTLCYATNDNQSATTELLNEEADLAVVVGGYNSSNTTHLVELLKERFPTYFISGAEEIDDRNTINGFDIHKKERVSYNKFIPEKEKLKIIITSGASCPDASVDEVIQTIMTLTDAERPIQEVLEEWSAS